MTYVLLSLGSRGDVVPMVTLGRELRRRGEQVKVVGLAEYAVLAERASLAFEPVRATLAETLWVDRPWVRRAMLAQSGLMYLGMLERFTSSATRVADAILRAIRPGDVVVTGLVTLDAAQALAATGEISTALALFSPVLPSADPESTIWAMPLLGAGLINQVVSRIGWGLGSRLSALVGRQIRTRLGLDTSSGRVKDNPLPPLLLGTSPVLVPNATDWPAGLVQTGAWRAPDDPGADLPDEVTAFLAAGEPPVYVGFGSMPAADPAADLALFVRAARRARCRLVVQPPPGVRLDDTIDQYDDVLSLPELPHARLFPHLAGIVHHGGAGTTVAALRAGLPSAMVPHLGDQGYWGRRVARLGAGPLPVPRRQLTEASLARLITSVAEGAEAVGRRRRAGELSARLDAERGTAVAADAVQGLA